MVFLARREDGKPVPLTEIVGGEGIPGPFLERILARLRDAGLVATTRGVSGGYQLARRPESIDVLDVVTALEGPLSLIGCLPDDSACERSDSCASRAAWRRLDAAISEALSSVTLHDLTVERERQ